MYDPACALIAHCGPKTFERSGFFEVAGVDDLEVDLGLEDFAREEPVDVDVAEDAH